MFFGEFDWRWDIQNQLNSLLTQVDLAVPQDNGFRLIFDDCSNNFLVYLFPDEVYYRYDIHYNNYYSMQA